LGAIAREKAGIMRPGRAALLAEQRPAAMRALRRACRDVGAACAVVPPTERKLTLAGQHQWQNAALAVAAARQLADVDDAAIERGLARLRWPGRFEVVRGDPPIVLDGAHNGASAEALAVTLKRYAAARPIHFVIGINRDKDARAVLRPLLPLAQSVWATETADNPRALPAADLARLCRRLGVAASVEADLSTAVGSAGARAWRRGVVCVTGSLMLIGQARATLGLPAVEKLW
jgi:dihydrofolate synthase/folylpolyglutamate synthase